MQQSHASSAALLCEMIEGVFSLHSKPQQPALFVYIEAVVFLRWLGFVLESAQVK